MKVTRAEFESTLHRYNELADKVGELQDFDPAVGLKLPHTGEEAVEFENLKIELRNKYKEFLNDKELKYIDGSLPIDQSGEEPI